MRPMVVEMVEEEEKVTTEMEKLEHAIIVRNQVI